MMAACAYDYIIIGGGTAGCVLANRLTERGDLSVLVVESGPDARPMLMNMPAGLGALYEGGRYHWPYQSQPEPYAADKSPPYKMGRVLGGSSAINGLVWVRGNPADFDDWASQGAEGWDWRSLEPYFRRIEAYEDRTDLSMGHDGPIPVTRGRPEQQILASAFLAAASQAGEYINPNYNSGNQDGFCTLQQNTSGGKRGDVRRGYLDPIRKRSNLTVLTGHLVRRLSFSGNRCVGIEASFHGKNLSFAARCEVLLCAGAIASPQLLEISGIGCPNVLGRAGVSPVHPLPGVGKNFHTHPTISMTFETNGSYSILESTRGWGKLWAGLRWILARTGAAATNHFEAGAFLRAFPDSDRPDYQLTFLPLALGGTTGAVNIHGYQIYVELVGCRSRGYTHIVSDDVAAQPEFRFNFLEDPRDVAVYRQSVEMIRRIVSQPALATLTKRELTPGVGISDEQALEQWIRNAASLSHHLAGSCRMGAREDEHAVVGPDLRLRGLDGLRVIDASVMPKVTTGNTHAAVIAIAEKGADLILGRSTQ